VRRPVVADIERDTLMVSDDSLRECLSERTRLIVPVHFAGAPADIDFIRRLLAARNNIFLADDAATRWERSTRVTVSANRTAIFSFTHKKYYTGEGGMFCSDNPELLESIRQLKFHGLGVDAYDRFTHAFSQAQVLAPDIV